MSFVDDIDLVLAADGNEMDLFQQIPDFVDTAVGGGVDLDHIHKGAFGNAAADLAFVAGFAVDGMFAVQSFGEDPRGAGLAGTPGAAEQIGMNGAAAKNGVFQHTDIILLTDEGFKILRPPFAVQS